MSGAACGNTDVVRAQQLAERRLRELEGPVVRIVVGRLHKRHAWLPKPDIEAAYNRAWHGVYESIAQGKAVQNLTGFLVEVTYMRSIDIYRERHQDLQSEEPLEEQIVELDLAERIDNQQKINGLLVRLAERLNEKERSAVSLCLLRGYPRAETAKRLGLTDRALKKVMDSANKKLSGVVKTMQARGCGDDEWARAVRAFALGITDPDSPDYERIAHHIDDCQPCKQYVLCLRGLTVIFPPILPLLGHPEVLLAELRKLSAPIHTANGIAAGGTVATGAPAPGAATANSSAAGWSSAATINTSRGVLSTLGSGGGLAKTAALAGMAVASGLAGITAVHALDRSHHERARHGAVTRKLASARPTDGLSSRDPNPLGDSTSNGNGRRAVDARAGGARAVVRSRPRSSVGRSSDRSAVVSASTNRPSESQGNSEFGFEHAEQSSSSQPPPPPASGAASPTVPPSTEEEFGP